MSQRIIIHGDYLKPRQLQAVLQTIQTGGVLLFPTDTGYSLLCRLGEKTATEKIRQIRTLDKNHPFAIFCANLSALSHYAKVDNGQYRLLKKFQPGLFICILPANKDAPKLLQHDKRKTIGIRVPESSVLQTILQEHGEALMGVSAFDSDESIADIEYLDKNFLNMIDLIIDAGERPNLPSSVVDLSEMPPVVIREGAGDLNNIF